MQNVAILDFLIYVPQMNHRSFWTNRKACTNCTYTGEELDKHCLDTENMFHDCTIQEPN